MSDAFSAQSAGRWEEGEFHLILVLQLIKQECAVDLHAPKYNELKVLTLWEYAREIEALYCYFPDYNEKQLPEREYLFKILSTVETDAMKKLIKQARESRSIVNQENDDEIIVIKNELREEINNVLAQKSKFLILLLCLF